MIAKWTIDGVQHQFNKKRGFSGTHRTSYTNKNSNLYPYQRRITLHTLLWDTLIRHKNYDRNSWRNHIITFGTFSHFWTILQVVELTSSHFWTILFSQTFSLTVSHFSTHSWEISEIVDEIQISDSSDSQAMVASQVSTGSIWKYK